MGGSDVIAKSSNFPIKKEEASIYLNIKQHH